MSVEAIKAYIKPPLLQEPREYPSSQVRQRVKDIVEAALNQETLDWLPSKEEFDGAIIAGKAGKEQWLDSRIVSVLAMALAHHLDQFDPEDLRLVTTNTIPWVHRTGDDLYVSVPEYAKVPNKPPVGLAWQAVDQGRVMLTHDRIHFAWMQFVASRYQGQETLTRAPGWIKKAYPEATDLVTKRLRAIKNAKEKLMKLGNQPSFHPMCIRTMLEAVQTGQPVSHTERFLLVAFLSNVGMSEQEIAEVFIGGSDFNRSKTEYQVQHIAMTKERMLSETGGYFVTGCAKLKDYGLCPDRAGTQCKGGTEWRRRSPLFEYNTRITAQQRRDGLAKKRALEASA